MGWKVGDHITLRGTDAGHMQMDFIIIGTIENTALPEYLPVPARLPDGIAQGQRTCPTQTSRGTSSCAPTAPPTLQPLAKNIDEHFTNSDYETRTMTESDALASGLSALGNIRGIVFALCAVVVLTVLLIAANSTAMMVRERISEVAVMRSLGFSRGVDLDAAVRRVRLIGAVGGAHRREHRAVDVS